MADRPYNVLFLCTGNSARSIIAAAILNKVGAGRFRAYSAGSQPKGNVNPHTIHLLQNLGHQSSQRNLGRVGRRRLSRCRFGSGFALTPLCRRLRPRLFECDLSFSELLDRSIGSRGK